MSLLFIIGIVVLNVAKINAESNGGTSTSLSSNTTFNTTKELIGCSNKFSINLFKTITNNSGRSIVIPGYSVFLAMTIAAFGSRAKTSKQIRENLQLPKNDRDVVNAIEEMNHKMQNRRTNDWAMYHGLWVYGVTLKSDYRSSLTRMLIRVHRFKDRKSQQGREILYNSYTRYKCSLTKLGRLSGKYRYGTIPEIDATFVQIPCMDKDLKKHEYIPITKGSDNRSTTAFVVFPNRANGFENLTKQIDKISLKKLMTADLRDVDISIPYMEVKTFKYIKRELSKMGFEYMMLSNMEDYKNMSDVSTITSMEMQMVGLFAIRVPLRASITRDPGVTGHRKPIRVNVHHSFISIVTMFEEDPLIITIARHVVSDDAPK